MPSDGWPLGPGEPIAVNEIALRSTLADGKSDFRKRNASLAPPRMNTVRAVNSVTASLPYPPMITQMADMSENPQHLPKSPKAGDTSTYWSWKPEIAR